MMLVVEPDAVAELGVRVMRQNSEFSDGVHWRLQDEAGIDAVEVVGAVDQEIVRLRTLAIDGIALAVAQGATGFQKARRQGHNTGLQNAELREVAAVEGKIENFLCRTVLPRLVTVPWISWASAMTRICWVSAPTARWTGTDTRLVDVQRDSFLQIFLEALGLTSSW